MLISPRVLAKKYAIAFVDVYRCEFCDDFLNGLSALNLFLKKNRYLYVYLMIPSVSLDIKKKVLDTLSKTFNLSNGMKKLIGVLLEHDRIEILDKVVIQIIRYYRKQVGEEFFRVSSSHELGEKEKETVIKFIKHHSKNKVKAKFFIDERLIVGLRIKSNTFLWERSISKQLRDVKQFMFRQAGL